MLISLDSQEQSSNFEDACKQAVIHIDLTKCNLNDSGIQKGVKVIKKIASTHNLKFTKGNKSSKYCIQKPPLSRAMIDNLQSNKLTRKNKNVAFDKICIGKYHKKIRTKSRAPSENLRISRELLKVGNPLIRMNKNKYSKDAPRRLKTNRFRQKSYVSKNLTSDEKLDDKIHFISDFEEENCSTIKFEYELNSKNIEQQLYIELNTEFDSDLKLNINNPLKNLNKSCAMFKENTLNKACFVEIRSKENPTMIENNNIGDFYESLDESKINKLPGSDTKHHQTSGIIHPPLSSSKFISNQMKSDQLKRCKSEANNDEYDTVIIEEYNADMKNIRETSITNKPKLTKASSNYQHTFSSVSNSTADFKFSYRDTDHEVCNELDFATTDENDNSFIKFDKNLGYQVEEKKLLFKNKRNRHYAQVVLYQ